MFYANSASYSDTYNAQFISFHINMELRLLYNSFVTFPSQACASWNCLHLIMSYVLNT